MEKIIFGNLESVSWNKYREAEKIKDESQIPYLIELIERLKKKN